MRWDAENPQVAQDEEMRPQRTAAMRKKATKQWCRGKVGRAHVPQVVMGNWGIVCQGDFRVDRATQTRVAGDRWLCFHIVACSVCGKHLAYNVQCPDMPEGFTPVITPASQTYATTPAAPDIDKENPL